MKRYATHLLFVGSIIGLIFISRVDFTVFHLIAELYTIIIAASMFVIMWNSRQYLDNNYFLIIATGFLFASFIDFLHTLSYKGMPFFSGFTTNLPTQLWLAARYVQSLTFVIALFCIKRKTNLWLMLGIYSIITLSLVLSIFSGIFPDAFLEGSGLTAFKVFSEYIIMLIFVIGAFGLFKNKLKFDNSIFWLIAGSILVTILSELSFTFYVTVTGLYSVAGHLLKVLAFYLISQALINVALEKPYSIIFRELKQKETELEEARSHYQTLFMESPVRIFEEDFSLVKVEIDKLRSGGISDLRKFFESNPNAVKDFCKLVHILSWNKEAERFFPNLPWKNNISEFELFPELELAGINNEFIAVSNGVRGFNYETSTISPAGKEVNKLISWAVVSGHEHDYSKVIVIVQDVSGIKQLTDKLRVNEEKYRLLFENAGIVIGCYDLEGNILTFNNKALSVMGGNIEDFIGKNAREILGPDLGKKILERIKLTAQSGGGEQYEDYIQLSAGNKWFISTYSQITNNQSKCTGVQVVSQDISDRKILEKELHQYSNQLEGIIRERTEALESAQAKLIRQEKLAVMGQMASSVGHELRNPLAVINNAVYVLGKTIEDQNAQTKTYLQIIGQEVGTADKIISDLLNFARIKSVSRKDTSLVLLVKKVLERFFPPENISVELKLAQDLLPIIVDAGQIEQVLINLITNAYQAMPDGGKLIISGLQKKDKVSLMVEDNGIGIEKQNLEKIFEPLFTTKAKGIGLGLTVTKMLTEANEGTIKVTSKFGKGTIFTVTLPTK